MTGFVVLHYLAYEMTLQCTESLLGLAGEKHVVIVDNASPGGSGQRLAQHFAGKAEVTVLLSPQNEGFARGNNLGYCYLREHFSCEFVVVLNNDVLIPDTAFIGKVASLYRETPFAVLGPDILNPGSGLHQNPAHLRGFTREEVWQESAWDVVLHGACFVFSQDFIRVREYAFNPGTFLYFEEDILHHECLQQGLHLLYSPKVQVQHLEDVATNKAYRTNAQKEKMKLQESVRSMEVLLNLMRR